MIKRTFTVLFLLSFLNITVSAGTLPNPIVFVKQKKVDHSGGTIQDLFGNFQGRKPAEDQPVGGGLYLLTPTGELRTIIAGPHIAVRDPEISPDALRVIFAMKQGSTGKWQIWESGIDGSGLRKISQNSSFNDFDPAYIGEQSIFPGRESKSDEKIVFLSDRLRLADPFLNLPSAQIHAMNPNGKNVRSLLVNPGGQNNPIPSLFGVLLFSQFDYHDRRDNIQQPPDPLDVNRFLPWFIYGDGSGFDHPFFGSHTIPDFRGGYVSVRDEPLKGKLVGILADEKNTYGAGSIVKMNYGRNDDREHPAFVTTNVFGRGANNTSGRWRDPYPMSDGSILASYANGPVFQSKAVFGAKEIPNFRIVRLTENGKVQETVYEDNEFWNWQPVEVFAKGQAFVYPGVSQDRFKYAMINTLDVFNRGRNFRKVVNGDKQPDPERGSIASVRIFKSVKRPNGNSEFKSYSDSRLIELGSAPVYSDGSFAALVPIDTPLIWELLDQNGKVVIRERFGTTLKGGEIRFCYGCHAPHDGRTGNTINMAQPFATNMTPYDPDQDRNGVLDILESFIPFPTEKD